MKAIVKILALGIALFLVNGCTPKYKFDDANRPTKNTLKLIKSACNQGAVKECNVLGFAYYQGEGVPQDRLKAIEYFKKACHLGKTDVCLIVATAYDQGLYGLNYNVKEAIKYYSKGCDNGDPHQCGLVAYYYYDDKYNIPADKKKFLKFFEKSCKFNFPRGCVVTGMAYHDGVGIKKDKQKAINFFKKACDLGQETGCIIYKKLKEEGLLVSEVFDTSNPSKKGTQSFIAFLYTPQLDDRVEEDVTYKGSKIYGLLIGGKRIFADSIGVYVSTQIGEPLPKEERINNSVLVPKIYNAGITYSLNNYITILAGLGSDQSKGEVDIEGKVTEKKLKKEININGGIMLGVNDLDLIVTYNSYNKSFSGGISIPFNFFTLVNKY